MWLFWCGWSSTVDQLRGDEKRVVVVLFVVVFGAVFVLVVSFCRAYGLIVGRSYWLVGLSPKMSMSNSATDRFNRAVTPRINEISVCHEW